MRGPERQLQVILLAGDGRQRGAVSLGPRLIAGALGACLLLPMGAGVALGAASAGPMHGAPRLAALGQAGLAGVRWSRATAYRALRRATPARKKPPPVPAIVLPLEPATPEARRGHLRIHSLHLREDIDVVPFDENGVPDERAFAAVAHLFRCRITGHETPVNERLVRLMTALNDLYDRPLHLISGHRLAHTIDTSETSQHTRGTAADIRVPGVGSEELRAMVIELGARGVGLYPHDRFVHVDFRHKRKYFWRQEPELAPALLDDAAQATPQHVQAQRKGQTEEEGPSAGMPLAAEASLRGGQAMQNVALSRPWSADLAHAPSGYSRGTSTGSGPPERRASPNG